METRLILYADEGKILTNGETYGAVVYLSFDDNPDNWHEITIEEYDAIMAEQDEII